MIQRYNAFISYRHVKRDIKVAEEIQTQLEHYKIPKSIVEKTGIAKIDRIFRDKSELPITSNLTDDIKTALECSDYLIVICSPETNESLWIKREIELFLEHHPLNHVLTVLSAGEPQNVIPEILLSRDVKINNESGEVITVKEQIEPLSCDYRLPVSKARKEELPRLVSALIGCSYDELVQRANQYRLRRWRIIAASIGTASLAAVSYLIWSNHQIKTNFEKSQINMSMHLADQSLNALDDLDRISAIQYALDALPDENTDRPVIAEAEYALAKAIGVYEIPDKYEFRAMKRFETGSFIKDFLINPARDRMVAIDRDNTVYIWDLADEKLCMTIKNTETSAIKTGYDHGFFLISQNYTSLHDWNDGHIIWENFEKADEVSLVFEEDSEFIGRLNYKQIQVMDLLGNTVYSYSFGKEYDWNTPSEIQLNKEGTDAVCSVGAWDESYIALVDFTNQKATVLADNLGRVDYVDYTDNGDILIAEFGNDLNNTSGDSLFNFYSVYKMQSNVYLYDSSMNLKWKRTIEFEQPGDRSFEQIEFEDSQGKLHDGLICNLGYLQVLLNIDDGTVYKSTDWPASIKNVISKNDNTCFSLLENGDLAVNSFTDYSSGLHSFVNGAQKALIYKTEEGKLPFLMVLPDVKPYILEYVPSAVPDGFERLKNIPPAGFKQLCHKDNYIAYSYHDESYDYYVSVYDCETGRVLYTYPLDDSDEAQLAFSADGKTLFFMAEDNYRPVIKQLSLPDLSEKTIGIITSDSAPYEYFGELSCTDIHYLYIDYTVDAHLDETTGEVIIDENSASYQLIHESFELNQNSSDHNEQVLIKDWQYDWKLQNYQISDDGEHCLVEIRKNLESEEQYELYLVNNPKTETEMILVDSSQEPHYKCAFSDGKAEFAVPYVNEIKLYDMNGNVKECISYKENSFLAAAYIDDELYLLTTDHSVYRYGRNRKLIRTYEIGDYENALYSNSDVYTWTKAENTLYLLSNTMLADILNIVELDQNQSKAVIVDCIDYDIDQQRAFIKDDATRTNLSEMFLDYVGVMKIYTPYELIRLGQSIVSDTDKMPKE